jgi:hypothetical protein
MIPRKYVSRTYTLAAGERKKISVVSDWFVVLAADEEFQVGIDQEDPEWITAGSSINTAGYEQIVLYNPGAVSNVVKVAFSRQEVRDSRLTVSGVVTVKEVAPIEVEQVAAFEVKPLAPPIFGTLGDATIGAGTSFMIASGYFARAEMFIFNDGTERVYLRGDNALVASGLALEPGEKITLKTTANVYAYNPSGVGVKLRIDDTRWS